MEMRTDQMDRFHHFINQIGLCADYDELYFVALMAALALPDICGALESETGVATGGFMPLGLISGSARSMKADHAAQKNRF